MTRKHHRERLTDEAADWYVRVQDSQMSEEERAAFADWLVASAEHVREYMLCASVSMDIKDFTGNLDVDDCIRAARGSDDANVVELLRGGLDVQLAGRRKGLSGLITRRAMWSGGAILSLCCVILLAITARITPDVYSTDTSEQSSFRLEDGSIVTLNARSRIRVEFSENLRSIRLIEGEALFDVTKDPLRPFQVRTSQAIVRAVGTVFDVRNRNGVTTVTVVEGAIDVHAADTSLREIGNEGSEKDPEPSIAPARVVMGEQVKVLSGSSRIIELPDANVEGAIAWRERRLVFSAKPLSSVVDEFNLYNESKIVIVDPPLEDRLVSGTFSADDQESFVLFLSEANIAKYEKLPDGRLLLARPGH